MSIHQRLNWEQCKKDFEFDGTWRDIYILNTNSDDWNKFLKSLLNSKYETKFWIDGEVAKEITSIQEALEIQNHASPYMLIDALGVQIACHFFTDEEIEFDIDPRQVSNQQDLDAVINFMIFLGDLLQKKAILTPENTPNLIVIDYNPKTGLVKHYDVDFLEI